MLGRLLVFIFFVSATCPLAAKNWLRTEHDKFIIHAKLDESEIEEVARRVERFDLLLRAQLPPQTAPTRKFEIFLDENIARMSQAAGMKHLSAALTVPEFAGAFAQYDPGEKVEYRYYPVFVAYTNYYLDTSFFRTLPPWLRAGLPPFYGTALLNEEADFILGIPDFRRPMDGNLSETRIGDVLSVQATPRTERDWPPFLRASSTFVYPLLSDVRFDGAIEGYLARYNKGASLDESAEVFGDLGDVATAMHEFRRGKPVLRKYTLPDYTPGPFTTRPMSDDEIALVALRFERLFANNPDRTAKKLAKVTELFPESADAWYEYAAAEYARVQDSLGESERSFNGFGFPDALIVVTAGRLSDETAWRAVNKALVFDPDHPQAIRLKAEIQLARMIMDDGGASPAEFEALRLSLEPLARDPSSYPYAAALQFETYLEQGIAPPREALDRLGRAFLANPGVEEIRYAYAAALVRAREKDAADLLLRSMLNDPRYRDAAQRALNQPELAN